MSSPLFSSQSPDDNAIKAGEAGAIEMIVKAMNTYINDAVICELGCGTLVNITWNYGK